MFDLPVVVSGTWIFTEPDNIYVALWVHNWMAVQVVPDRIPDKSRSDPAIRKIEFGYEL